MGTPSGVVGVDLPKFQLATVFSLLSTIFTPYNPPSPNVHFARIFDFLG